METTVKQRLTTFYISKGYTKRGFERACGFANGYMDKLRLSPSPSKLEKIYLTFPELNRNWLLTGEGEMLTSPSQQINGDHNSATANNVSGDGNHVGNVSTDNQIISKALDEIAAQRRLTEKAHEQIDRLLDIIEKIK